MARRSRDSNLTEPRAHVWLDAVLEDQLRRLSLPGTSPAVMLRLLARAAFAEIEGMPLSEGLRRVAPTAWAAVAQRRKTPQLLDKLPQCVDEYLEAVGASYATRAKIYALLLPLSPLSRLALLVYGSQRAKESEDVTEREATPLQAA